MSKKDISMFVKIFIVALLIVVVTSLLKNKMFVEGKDAKYWHEAYIQEIRTTKTLKDCVNTGTILGPMETYKTLLDLVAKVRNNCQIF